MKKVAKNENEIADPPSHKQLNRTWTESNVRRVVVVAVAAVVVGEKIAL